MSVLTEAEGLACLAAQGVPIPVATPTPGSNGAAPASYVDVSVAGAMRVQHISANTAATSDGASAMLTTQFVYRVTIKILTAYDHGAVDVGQAGHATDFANHAASGADPKLADLSLAAVGDIIIVHGITPVAAAAAPRVSISGAPTTGSMLVAVEYGVPN